MNRAFTSVTLAILAACSAAEVNVAATEGGKSCEAGSACPLSLNDETALLQKTVQVQARAKDEVDVKKHEALVEETDVEKHEALTEEQRSLFHANGTRRVPMDFTYFRHGQSTGNAGKFWRYGDGVLTETGLAQATRRVGFLNRAQLVSIVTSQLVAVSPLRRAMGTALIIMAAAMKRCANNGGAPITQGWCANPGVNPTVTVYTNLREKYQSNSEAPNCGWGSALGYITEIFNANRGGLTPNQLAVFTAVRTAMDASYRAAFAQAAGKAWDNTCVTWHPLPTDGFQYALMIRDWKDAVMAVPATSMLVVAHSGWARFGFSSFLPNARAATSAADSLIHGGRKITALNNCGMVAGELQAVAPVNRGVSGAASKFQNVVVDATDPGDDNFPNCHEEKFGIFVSDREAMDMNRMPPNSHSELLIMEKKMQGMTGSLTDPRGGFETRIITLGWSGHPNAGTVGWADEMGKPKHHCDLSNANQAVRTNPSPNVYQVEVTCSQGGQAKRLILRPGRTWQLDGTHAMNTMTALRNKINAYADPNNAPVR